MNGLTNIKTKNDNAVWLHLSRLHNLPYQVVRAIDQKYGDSELREVLTTVKYSVIMGCWWFERGGVLSAVEEDGYIHT